GEGGSMFPTGNLVDTLEVPNIGSFEVTMINAGIPTVFLNAGDLGYNGTELQDHMNNDAAALAKFETIRAYAAKQMGLIQDIRDRKSTRLNSSHVKISYAVFCLKKKIWLPYTAVNAP